MSKRILVIDDDEAITIAFQVVLEMAGYEVTTSMNTDVIKKLTKKTLPDLILLDVLLSGADGRLVCKALKKDKLTKDIPIIMVSAHPSASKSTLEAGANGFISKPFEMKELLDTVKEFTVK